MIGGPTSVAIWLRAGWSLGPVQSRYIFQGQGGDQFVGRAATLLELNSIDFSVLPPHFSTNEGPVITTQEWNQILPGFSTYYPDEFKVALPFLLASIVHHQDWLNATLPKNHPFFSHRMYLSGLLHRLKAKVHVGHFKNEVSNLQATGIPPYVMLANRMYFLEKEMAAMKRVYAEGVEAIPDEVCKKLLKNFNIEGVQQVTIEQLQMMFNQFRSDIMEDVRKCALSGGNSTIQDALEATDNAEYKVWNWGGRLHMVPENWRFPKCCCYLIWESWWCGNKMDKISPLRHLKNYDLTSQSDRTLLSKARKVIDAVILISNLQFNDIKNMSVVERDSLFESSFFNLCCKLCDVNSIDEFNRRRFSEVSYVTIYDYIIKSKKQL